jgi:hypothetical protein
MKLIFLLFLSNFLRFSFAVKVAIDDVKMSVAKLAETMQTNHMMKALDGMTSSDNLGSPVDPRVKLAETTTSSQQLQVEKQQMDNEIDRELQQTVQEQQSFLPRISQSNNNNHNKNGKFGSRKLPLYVQHAYPAIFPGQTQNQPGFVPGMANSLPKLSGEQENYGMLYNKPESAAEKTMHELWLARRQQEAFQHKTQQQLAIVMDRLALHRSRLESDALRRQESENMLKFLQQQPPSNNNNKKKKFKDDDLKVSDEESNAGKDAGASRGRIRGMSERLRRDMDVNSPLQSPDQRGHGSRSRSRSRHSPSPESRSHRANASSNNNSNRPSVIVSGNAVDSVPMPARTTVPRATLLNNNNNNNNPTRNNNNNNNIITPAPMRFKIELDYLQRQQYYMQLSDDEDDAAEKNPPLSSHPHSAMSHHSHHNNNSRKGTGAAGDGSAGNNNNNNKEILFKREKVEIHDRPKSASIFRKVTANDPEMKVYYRYTNYRRQVMTKGQLAWVEERELQRKVFSENLAHEMFAKANAKGDKKGKDKKDGGKDKKDKKKKDKKNEGKSRPGSATSGKGSDDDDKPKPKYKSASQFMNMHFPNFEQEAEEDIEHIAPMRALQLAEVNEVMEACGRFGVPVKESSLRKALIVPMDKPEAICLEGLRENKEGLMVNPLPPENWRVFKMSKGGGKKKKKKKA